MQVIAGSARGVPLRVPPGLRVRPTSGRVRTSLFSILGDSVVGARVADLFAGSGALGIEALSRGAAFCCFVENARPALAALRENLAKTRLADKAEVLACDAFAAASQLAACGPFGLVLLDPPYRLVRGGGDPFIALLDRLAAGTALAPGALVIVQHDTATPLPQTIGRLAVSDQRTYGDTTLTFLE
ncbi:MAG: 16S rRNA (guanine(966)-N(2))-methyltransferase RsmD [Planctomycetes bacterium]|nr:16S rRNA (guanine(966)-N(2))-methyltransferase RsmD [Planctomycetota bacterium]